MTPIPTSTRKRPKFATGLTMTATTRRMRVFLWRVIAIPTAMTAIRARLTPAIIRALVPQVALTATPLHQPSAGPTLLVPVPVAAAPARLRDAVM